jgi:hypothetical protein
MLEPEPPGQVSVERHASPSALSVAAPLSRLACACAGGLVAPPGVQEEPMPEVTAEGPAKQGVSVVARP